MSRARRGAARPAGDGAAGVGRDIGHRAGLHRYRRMDIEREQTGQLLYTQVTSLNRDEIRVHARRRESTGRERNKVPYDRTPWTVPFVAFSFVVLRVADETRAQLPRRRPAPGPQTPQTSDARSLALGDGHQRPAATTQLARDMSDEHTRRAPPAARPRPPDRVVSRLAVLPDGRSSDVDGTHVTRFPSVHGAGVFQSAACLNAVARRCCARALCT